MTSLTIGKLAAAANVNVETVRYYQRIGLLTIPDTVSGYRHYNDQYLQQLQFIRHAKEAGFTLEEVATLLRLDAIQDRTQIRELAESRLHDIERRIQDLQGLAQQLKVMVQQCAREAGSICCPIVETLKQHEAR
jgi:DNA-binding transcriptional MerR regulator